MTKKVTELPAATTPLGASDILMVIQGGVSKQSPVSGLPSSGGGLTNLTESKNVSAPNATVPAVSLAVSITETNGDVAYVAKGTGATLARIPDNTSGGGNKRGIYATDWQKTGSVNTNVASGDYSTISGGRNNTAAGTSGTIVGGEGNSASGTKSIAGGANNFSTADSTVAFGGDTQTASAQYAAAVGGNQNTASAAGAAIFGGRNNTADGINSSIAGGQYASTRAVTGMEARASGRFAANGDAQRCRLIVRASTTDATATKLTSDGAAASGVNRFGLVNTATYAFRGHLVARSSADDARFTIDGLITRRSGTTALVGSPTVTKTHSSGGAGSWSVSVTADIANNCLDVTVTGVAATAIKWVADLETVEVVG